MPDVMDLSESIRTFLGTERVGHLATADASGRPHVIPIAYAVSGRTLYSVLDHKPKRVPSARLRRLRNIRANPRVAIVVDRYSEDWGNLEYVLLEGTARIVQGGEEHTQALRVLRQRYPQYQAMALEDRPIIAVDIERAVHWTARQDGDA